ncbi:alpha/beta hydrolase [Mycobacterium sp. AMU20-3851]|uniref:alpha/beta hydrolase n=1 Tax=Mycobacterium sp. AMU20-3851 TaxID=3122055 RepID=UPI003754D08C
MLGSAAMDDRLCRRYANELEVVVVAVDYRLAPEHPYPAALTDCYEALAWMAVQPEIDSARLAVVGASAGGGLAAALAQQVHDRAEITLAGQVLLYPMLDDRPSRYHDPGFAVRRLWNAGSSRLGWSAYLSCADPAMAVPARRHDLGGLAPAWIGVGDRDILCAEAREYARRLSEAAVSCDLVVVAGAFHGFDAVAPTASVSEAFFRGQCAMLRNCLGLAAPQSCA